MMVDTNKDLPKRRGRARKIFARELQSSKICAVLSTYSSRQERIVEKEELPNGSAYTQETDMMVTKMRIQATV